MQLFESLFLAVCRAELVEVLFDIVFDISFVITRVAKTDIVVIIHT